METKYTALTENSDPAHVSSGSACLDFFTKITRNAEPKDYLDSFAKAWAENPVTASKILMNLRDIRGGKGEKLIPIVIITYLKQKLDPHVYQLILAKMLDYGCWKDILRVMEMTSRLPNIRCNKDLTFETNLFADQLKKDMESLEQHTNTNDKTKVAISLCGKWAPSEYSHFNKHPTYAAKQIMITLGISVKAYRQMLSKLRNHLTILEKLMSTHQYDKIDFSKLPAVAHMKMKPAFMRTTNAIGIESEPRKQLQLSYKQYLNNLATGRTKVNVKGIQPHELVSTYLDRNSELDPLVEAQWVEIKNRVIDSGAFKNVTAVVDVSGSMFGQPMSVSIALGILVAECTTGPFHGKVITFHEKPSWHHLLGNNLKEQVQCLGKAPWGGSINLRAVFDIILKEAIAAKLTQEEMVKTLFIFTDMQFDSCCHGSESTLDYARRTYVEAGYQLPNIICWNLRTSSANTMPLTSNENNVAMLSGFSAELLKCVLTAKEINPMAMMMHILEPYPTLDLASSSQIDLTPDVVILSQLSTCINKSQIKKCYLPKKAT
jgi:Domain of unknown function (DUF2828).